MVIHGVFGGKKNLDTLVLIYKFLKKESETEFKVSLFSILFPKKLEVTQKLCLSSAAASREDEVWWADAVFILQWLRTPRHCIKLYLHFVKLMI